MARSTNVARALSSQTAPLSRYGVYCAKIDIMCLPGGASDWSYAVGMVISSSGSRDGAPYLASSQACSRASRLAQMWVVPRCCGPRHVPGSAE